MNDRNSISQTDQPLSQPQHGQAPTVQENAYVPPPHQTQPQPQQSQQSDMQQQQQQPQYATTGGTQSGAVPVASSASVGSSDPTKPSPDGTVTLSLRTLTGQVMKVYLQSLAGMSVLQLKQQIEAQHSIPANHIRLIAFGRELQDAHQLNEYAIVDGVMLHMLLRTIQQPDQVGPNGQPLPGQLDANGYPIAGAAVLDIPSAIAVDGSGFNQDPSRIARVYQLARIIKLFCIIDLIFVLLWQVTCLHTSCAIKPGFDPWLQHQQQHQQQPSKYCRHVPPCCVKD